MSDLIDKRILEEFTLPELVVNEYDFRIGNNIVKRHLASKQIIRLTATEGKKFLKKEATFLIPRLHQYYKSSHDEIPGEITDFSSIQDGYLHSEYFGEQMKYSPSIEYLRYLKSSQKGLIINLYDGENLFRDIDQSDSLLSEKAFMESARYQLPDYPFKRPEKVFYTAFKETSYLDNVSVDCCYNPIPLLSINLPYEYYEKQYLPRNIYNWDVEKKEYSFGGKTVEEFETLFDKICHEGIQQPLFMRINKGKITSINDETLLILFIAKYLRIPTIPVTLYLSNEDVMIPTVNELLEATNVFFGKQRNKEGELIFINEICYPYFVFQEVNEEDKKSRQFKSGGRRFNKAQYLPSNQDEDVLNRYLDTGVPEVPEEPVVPQFDEEAEKRMIDENNQRLLEEANEQVDKEIKAVLNTLKTGTDVSS